MSAKYFVSYSFHAAAEGLETRTADHYSQGFGNMIVDGVGPFETREHLAALGKSIVQGLEGQGRKDVQPVVLNVQRLPV